MPVSERGEEWLAYYLAEEDSYFQLKETLKNQNCEENKVMYSKFNLMIFKLLGTFFV